MCAKWHLQNLTVAAKILVCSGKTPHPFHPCGSSNYDLYTIWLDTMFTFVNTSHSSFIITLCCLLKYLSKVINTRWTLLLSFNKLQIIIFLSSPIDTCYMPPVLLCTSQCITNNCPLIELIETWLLYKHFASKYLSLQVWLIDVTWLPNIGLDNVERKLENYPTLELILNNKFCLRTSSRLEDLLNTFYFSTVQVAFGHLQKINEIGKNCI